MSATLGRAGSRTRDRSPWWLVLGSALALIVGTGPVIQFSFAVFMKPLAVGLNANRGTLALAPAIGLLAMGLATPLFGWLADRYGVRRVVPPCVLATGIAFALLGTATSVTAFVALYCIGSIFAGGYSPMPFAKAVSARFHHRRGLALGVTMAGLGVGTALVPLVSQAMIAAWGWHWAYVGLGVLICVVALPATLLTLPRSGVTDARESIGLAHGASASQAIHTGSFWKLAVAFACVALATTGVMTHIVALLSDRGVSPGVAATALAVGGIALIAGRLLSGYLIDKLFAPMVAAAFFASALIGIILLLVSPGPGIAWAVTGMIGLSLGAEVDLIAYLICRYLGQRAFGAIYGYLFLAFTLGTAAGPLAMGVCYTRTGRYTPAMIGFALGLVLALLLVLRLGEYRYNTDGEPNCVSEV